jgi:hypothetical protein
VTLIIDKRAASSNQTRYMTHQVKADNQAAEEIAIQVTEVKQIIIAEPTKASKNEAKESAASASAAAAMQTVTDPNAPFAASNATVILPSGAPAPTAPNVDFDPAAILEDGQTGLLVMQAAAAASSAAAAS